MSYDDNPYYKPDKFGLEVVGSVEKEPDYDFDIFMVWKRVSDGALFYATDSGCSCPSPFESYSGIADLTQITRDSYEQFLRDLREHAFSSYDFEQGRPDTTDAAKRALAQQVRELFYQWARSQR